MAVFIDALDQLTRDDPASTLDWLPRELPPQVKLIVSTTEIVERLAACATLHIDRLSVAEGSSAFDGLLAEAGRAIQPWQRATLLRHFERCGLPLYLKLAAEECKLWRSYASEMECSLGEGLTGIIDTLLDRLANNSNHGRPLVERSLSYLAVARYGLTEQELLDVLTEDEVVWTDFRSIRHHSARERRLPDVLWSRLFLDLEPYLTERAGAAGVLVGSYHRQVSERVIDRFLPLGERQDRHPHWLNTSALSRPGWMATGLT